MKILKPVFVECLECVRLGEPTCIKPNYKWPPGAVHGCTVREEDRKYLVQHWAQEPKPRKN